MRPAPSLAAFLRRPIGAFLRGRRFLCGFPTPSLQLLVGWGVITGEDGDELSALLRGQHRDLPRHASLTDLRAVTHVDASALAAMAAAMVDAMPVNRVITTRGAVVRPPGVSGMAVAGFWQVVDGGYPTEVFTEPVAALTWLGHPAQRAARDLAAWTAAVDPSTSELADRVRAALGHGRIPTVGDLARRLGVSPRSLQRQLHRDGTSYRQEVEHARVRQAQELLREPGRSIKDVAARVGMSATAFATAFRRRTGLTPSAWRARPG